MRRKNDYYPTPEGAARVLRTRMGWNDNLRYAEPCVGDGALVRGLGVKPQWSNDIDPAWQATYHFDAADSPLPAAGWIITNPPFSRAYEILTNSWSRADAGVAFLLRLSFLEPTNKRQEFLCIHPPDKLLVLPRLSFTGDGKTDSVTCAWVIWDHYERRVWPTSIQVVSKEELNEQMRPRS